MKHVSVKMCLCNLDIEVVNGLNYVAHRFPQTIANLQLCSNYYFGIRNMT